MALPPDAHDEHRYALLGDQLLDAQQLTKAQVQLIRRHRDQLRCPVCKEPLIAKLGEVRRWHFAHHPDCEFIGHEPESNEHRLGKRRLEEWARSLYPQAVIGQEWRLPEISQIADVLVAVPGRPALALEIQYADLSPAQWRSRHAGYQALGINDIWVLGHTRLRKAKGKAVILDSLASCLVAAHQPLLYLNPRSAYITWVRLPASAKFRALAGERLGKTPADLVKAPLKQLRMDGATPYLSG